MKREVEESVSVLKKLLKPVVDGEISADDLKLDLWNELGFSLEKVIFNPETRDITIVTPDRPEKSAVIGKGGWVVGRLREEIGANSIHEFKGFFNCFPQLLCYCSRWVFCF